ncbi:hypothetical protein GW17_00056008 [Ensete ventricosum]|nr:hypothetical protein GW17_00056008 [Ensete ventricosum]
MAGVGATGVPWCVRVGGGIPTSREPNKRRVKDPHIVASRVQRSSLALLGVGDGSSSSRVLQRHAVVEREKKKKMLPREKDRAGSCRGLDCRKRSATSVVRFRGYAGLPARLIPNKGVPCC